jgi:hypothetical protein
LRTPGLRGIPAPVSAGVLARHRRRRGACGTWVYAHTVSVPG